MARAPRLYVPLDVGFFSDIRIMRAGEKAGWLYLRMLTEARRLDVDGVLYAEQIAGLGISDWRKRLDALVEQGAVNPCDDGQYVIVAYQKWNDTAAERAAAKRAEADRKAKARARAEAAGLKSVSA